jgi:N6-L-threonylcarbamoyladenine synthase
LVGITFARGLALQHNLPLIPVDHVQAHLYAAFLQQSHSAHPSHQRLQLPAIGLVISGGHTSLYRMVQHPEYERIGQTRDDAVGEAFDKVARILGLGYPGGPAIEALARSVPTGVGATARFPCARLGDTLDFSFSGIKTAVLRHTQTQPVTPESRPHIAQAFQSGKESFPGVQNLYADTQPTEVSGNTLGLVLSHQAVVDEIDEQSFTQRLVAQHRHDG